MKNSNGFEVVPYGKYWVQFVDDGSVGLRDDVREPLEEKFEDISNEAGYAYSHNVDIRTMWECAARIIEWTTALFDELEVMVNVMEEADDEKLF